ncbi:MAG: hypothetical protein O6928_06795 [Gammaproteobacteria bacterium]|nr:hypothetical protein [Gammaproteobacteria bacterium]
MRYCSNNLFVILSLLMSALLIAGCKSTTVIDQYREAPTTRVNKGDSIVVLGRRHSSDHETEFDFISCVGKSLSEGGNGIQVIPEKLFVDSMYPWFETRTAPMDVKNLGKLLQNPAIAKKFSDFRIRYFIWIDGFTERTDSSGSISCAIGPGGGGCFGFATWDDEANYEASVWDFNNLTLSGKISAETKGTSFMPAIIIPIPMLARVQANACRSMAIQIKMFLQQGGTQGS